MGKISDSVKNIREANRKYLFPFLFIAGITNPNLVVDCFNYAKEEEPLIITAIEYTITDSLAFDGLLDDPYEDKLGIKILGEPTAEDLENLVKFTEKYLDQSWIELGIEEIIIFSKEDKEKVDYIGKHREESLILDNQLWFFSGELKEDTFIHEVTHCKHKIKKQDSSFWIWESKWKVVAGPYDKAIKIQRRGMIGVESYIDGTFYGLKWGYVNKYGGKNMKEDIATYVEEVVTNPSEFRKVQTDFQIYYHKLELLLEADFIKRVQYEKALKHLKKAEEAKINI